MHPEVVDARLQLPSELCTLELEKKQSPDRAPRVPGVGHRRCASCLSQWLELIESHWLNSVG